MINKIYHKIMLQIPSPGTLRSKSLGDGKLLPFSRGVLRESKKFIQQGNGNNDSSSPQYCFSIDGSNFNQIRDDAIFIEKTPQGGYRIRVFISEFDRIITEQTLHFREATERAFSEYGIYRPNHMFPFQTGKLLSLEPDQKKNATAYEIVLDSNLDIMGEISVYETPVINRAALTPHSFKQQFSLEMGEIPELLGLSYQLSLGLLEKRLGRKIIPQKNGIVVLDNGNVIAPFDLIISEILLLLNSSIAEEMSESSIPFLYFKKMSTGIKIGSDMQEDFPYTKVTCPIRDIVALVLSRQYRSAKDTGFPKYSERDLQNLAIHYNNRTEESTNFLQESEKNIGEKKEKRRRKRLVENVHLLTEGDIKKHILGKKDIGGKMEEEILHRLSYGLISEELMTLLLLIGVNSSIKQKCKERLLSRYVSNSFFHVIKTIDCGVTYEILFEETEDCLHAGYKVKLGNNQIEKTEVIDLSKIGEKTRKRFIASKLKKLMNEIKKFIIENI